MVNKLLQNCSTSLPNALKTVHTHLFRVGGGRWSYCELVCYVSSVCDTTHRLPFSIDTVEQVLDMFRQRFIADVDANAIVYDLEDQDIISDGDLKEVTRTPSGVEQNQFLHRCLKRKATEYTLLQVCDIMIGFRGNSRMKQVGKEMKSVLETGRCCL